MGIFGLIAAFSLTAWYLVFALVSAIYFLYNLTKLSLIFLEVANKLFIFNQGIRV